MAQRDNHGRRWPILCMGIIAFILIGFNLQAASRAATAQPPLQEKHTAGPTPDWTAPHAPGQLLVKFADASAANAAALVAETGMAVQNTIPQLGIIVVEAPGTGSNEE